MADQQFCLRWNNHQSTLISVFDSLLENGTLVDCTLAAEGKYLKAHKVVLSACSPYLETLLSQHYEKHPIVILKDVKFTELKSMMDYMYRGEVNISQDQLGTFLKAAESLQIKGLSDNGADGDGRDVGSTSKGPPPRKTQPAASTRPVESQRSDLAPASPAHRSRDGSISPSSRKRRRTRRNSQDDDANMGDSHLDSNSCDLPSQAQSTPIVPNIPAAVTSSITTTPIKTIVKPEQTELVNRIDTSNLNSLPPESGLLKEKIEPISEPLLEPKTEYLDDANNDDSVEDLTLDDDDEMDEMDMSNMSNMSNMSRPGPSHGNDVSNQGFVPWQIGNQSGTDEVFMAAQEAVQAHRGDSQEQFNSDEIYRSPLKKKKRIGVQCRECGSMKAESGVIIHNSSCCENSDKKEQFKCHCGFTCSSKKKLSIHRVTCGMEVARPKKSFAAACSCGKRYTSKKGFTIHLSKCKGTTPSSNVSCKCGKQCASQRGLTLHQKCCPMFQNSESKSKKSSESVKSVGKLNSGNEPLCILTERQQSNLINKSDVVVLPKRNISKTVKSIPKRSYERKKITPKLIFSPIAEETLNINLATHCDIKPFPSQAGLKHSSNISGFDFLDLTSVDKIIPCESKTRTGDDCNLKSVNDHTMSNANEINTVDNYNLKPIVDHSISNVNVETTVVQDSSEIVQEDIKVIGTDLVDSLPVVVEQVKKSNHKQNVSSLKEDKEFYGVKEISSSIKTHFVESGEDYSECLRVVEVDLNLVSPDTTIKSILSTSARGSLQASIDQQSPGIKSIRKCSSERTVTSPINSQDLSVHVNLYTDASIPMKCANDTSKKVTSFQNFDDNVLDNLIVDDLAFGNTTKNEENESEISDKNVVALQQNFYDEKLSSFNVPHKVGSDDLGLNDLFSSINNSTVRKVVTDCTVASDTHQQSSFINTTEKTPNLVEDLETPLTSWIASNELSSSSKQEECDNQSTTSNTRHCLTVAAIKECTEIPMIDRAKCVNKYSNKIVKLYKLKHKNSHKGLLSKKILSCYFCSFKAVIKKTLKNHVVQSHEDLIREILR